MAEMGEKLWEPGADICKNANITNFMRWLGDSRNLEFNDYESLWQWSVSDIEAFWKAIWDYFELTSSVQPGETLDSHEMPGAEWFPGAKINYAEFLLAQGDADSTAIFFASEARESGTMSWKELREQVARLCCALKDLGVKPGDRVAAYLPTIPEAVVALLATARIGAVWSCCSPDFGIRSVLDRFSQIEPTVLIAVDGYRYGGIDFDRRAEVSRLASELSTVQHVIEVPLLFPPQADAEMTPAGLKWPHLMAEYEGASDSSAEDTDFCHPLWIVYSSGTTGPPKAMVHGHGGVLLEFLKHLTFHLNLKPSSRLFFFVTTGWIVFLALVGALATGSTIVLYDGNPVWPEPDTLWRMADELEVTHFGTSPAFVNMLNKMGVSPIDTFDLKALECVVCTGSPLEPASFAWIYEHVKNDLWVTSTSGGTDVASSFVAGVPTLPVHNGEIQARCLGLDVDVFDDAGQSLIDEEGELVVKQTMPSMPLYFWGDDGNQRYLESYFDVYPGIWRHGDLMKLTQRGSCIISGRSDSTLNRLGIRIGTSEIYRVIDSLDEILDSLVINLDLSGSRSFMPLFVVLTEGQTLDERLAGKICQKLKKDCSPRHVPDKIYAIEAIPYTLTGKKLEVPVKKILMGADPEKTANPDTMANPAALDYFIAFAKERRDYAV